MVKREILVSSNCQTGGIAAALQRLLPESNVHAVPTPYFLNEADEKTFVKETLSHVDVWVTTSLYELVDKYNLNAKKREFQLVKIPIIVFDAFHPDLTYVKNKKNDQFTKVHYNSAIAAWSYKNKLGADAALALYTKETFTKLGYFSYWDTALLKLKSNFAGTDIDFNAFFLHVKRRGLFMHSINHPFAFVLARLSQLAAVFLGEDSRLLNSSCVINDGLLQASWPVYPEIADHYGVSGGAFDWEIEGRRYDNLEKYLNLAFRSYVEQGLEPSNVEICRDVRILDEVLSRSQS